MTSRDSAVGPEPRVRSGARRDGHGSDLAEECDVVEAVPPLDDAVSAEAQDAFPQLVAGVRGGDLRPLIVWIHGGGWIYGSRRRLPPHLLDNAVHDQMLDAGYAVAAVDYLPPAARNWSYAAARCRGLA